jgi:hypothetical protein
MTEVARVPSLPSQALGRDTLLTDKDTPGDRTISTSGSQGTGTSAGGGRSGDPSDSKVDPRRTLAGALRTLAKKTDWNNFEAQASTWLESATNNDEKLHAAKRFHDGWRRIFGDKGMPTELRDVGAYDETKVSQTFRDTGKSLVDTALSHKDMIRAYDRLTKGGIKKTFSSAVSIDPRIKALTSASEEGSVAAGLSQTSHAQMKRQRKKERKRAASTEGGTKSTMGSKAPATDDETKLTARMSTSATEGEGTAPTKAESGTTQNLTKKQSRNAARQKQLNDYNARTKKEDAQKASGKTSQSAKRLSFSPNTTTEGASGRSSGGTTAAGTAETGRTKSTTADKAATESPGKAGDQDTKSDMVRSTTKAQATAASTLGPATTGGPATRALADRLKAATATTKQTNSNEESMKPTTDLTDPAALKDFVNRMGQGMSSAAEASMGKENWDKVQPVDPTHWARVTAEIKEKARTALNKAIKTQTWTPTADGYKREHTLVVGDEGKGTLRQEIRGDERIVEFAWTRRDDFPDSVFDFTGPTPTTVSSGRPHTMTGLSSGRNMDRLTTLGTAATRSGSRPGTTNPQTSTGGATSLGGIPLSTSMHTGRAPGRAGSSGYPSALNTAAKRGIPGVKGLGTTGISV